MALNLAALAPLGGLAEGLNQGLDAAQRRQIYAQQIMAENDRQAAIKTLGQAFREVNAIGAARGDPGAIQPTGGGTQPLAGLENLPQVPNATRAMDAPGGGLPQAGIGTGRGSVFGNYAGYRDPSDSGMTASGVPTSTPGIALRIPRTSPDFGRSYDVTTPEGRTFPNVRQTDYGPAVKTGRFVDISAGLAEQMYPGGSARSFPTDQNFTVRAHRTLDAMVDNTGNRLVKGGEADGPTVQDSSKTAMLAGRRIDPTQWGRVALRDAIDAVEKANPGASDSVKALAVMQLHKLLAPDDKFMVQQLMKQNEQDFRRELQDERERNQNWRTEFGAEVRRDIAAGSQAGQDRRLGERERKIDARAAANLAERQRQFDTRQQQASGKLTAEESAELRRLKAQQVSMNNQAAQAGGWAAASEELRIARTTVDDQIDELLARAEKRVGATPETKPLSAGRPAAQPRPEDSPGVVAPVPPR